MYIGLTQVCCSLAAICALQVISLLHSPQPPQNNHQPHYPPLFIPIHQFTEYFNTPRNPICLLLSLPQLLLSPSFFRSSTSSTPTPSQAIHFHNPIPTYTRSLKFKTMDPRMIPQKSMYTHLQPPKRYVQIPALALSRTALIHIYRGPWYTMSYHTMPCNGSGNGKLTRTSHRRKLVKDNIHGISKSSSWPWQNPY